MLPKRKTGLKNRLEQKGRPERTMGVTHPSSPAEAQCQPLRGSFLSRTLGKCDDPQLSFPRKHRSVGNNSLAFDRQGSQDLISSHINPLTITGESPRCCAPLCSIPPTPQTQEPRVEMPGTEGAAATIQILHTDKGPQAPAHGRCSIHSKLANTGCQ